MRCFWGIAVCAVLLCACSGSGGRASVAARFDCTGVEPVAGVALAAELVVDGLRSPVDLAVPPHRPDGRHRARDFDRLFIVEQEGRIRIVRGGKLVAKPFLDVSDLVTVAHNEQGLLGLAFHPDYESNGVFFINYTDTTGATKVVRYRVSADADAADPESARVVLEIPQPYPNHNGGGMAFDARGYLWVGTGDGGRYGDPHEVAQNDDHLLGKMLRLDVDVDEPPYRAAPKDNPNAGAAGDRALIWAKGLRNPWRFSFDKANGDLYIADVGQNEIEEIDYAAASSRGGENYGWDVFEGSRCYEPDPEPECPDPRRAGMVEPVHEYGRDQGCSVTGGFVYRGCRMPDLRGTYFYSDFCTGWIRTFRIVRGVAREHSDRTAELVASGFVVGATTSFGEDARGELYVLARPGEVWRLVPAASAAASGG